VFSALYELGLQIKQSALRL